MPKSNPEKQCDYYARMKDRGYVKVCVYVPPDRRDEITRIAAEMRTEMED